MKFVKSNNRATLKMNPWENYFAQLQQSIVQIFGDYKNLIVTITVHHFMKNFHSLPYLCRHYKLVLRLAGVFGFLQRTLALNKFAHPWFILCVKKRD